MLSSPWAMMGWLRPRGESPECSELPCRKGGCSPAFLQGFYLPSPGDTKSSLSSPPRRGEEAEQLQTCVTLFSLALPYEFILGL